MTTLVSALMQQIAGHKPPRSLLEALFVISITDGVLGHQRGEVLSRLDEWIADATAPNAALAIARELRAKLGGES